MLSRTRYLWSLSKEDTCLHWTISRLDSIYLKENQLMLSSYESMAVTSRLGVSNLQALICPSLNSNVNEILGDVQWDTL